jgi:acylphosphatase
MSVVCRKCLVSGRVQGVYYRATAAQRARQLGITGYARNLSDGRVEVLACGSHTEVTMFVEWLWTGSSASKVTAVEVSEIPVTESNLPKKFETG